MSLATVTKVIRCTYNSDSFIFGLADTALFSDLVAEIVSRFVVLRGQKFTIKYSCKDNPLCLVHNDTDVHFMMVFQAMVNAPFIDMIIFVDECDLSNVQQSSNIATDVSPTQESIFDTQESQIVGHNSMNNARSYMSDTWRSYIKHVNQRFDGGAKEFREKLAKYAVEVGFSYVYVKNDKSRVTAECIRKSVDGCKWRIHASLSPANGCFYIRTLNNVHSCCASIRDSKSAMMNSKIIASEIREKVRENPMLSPTAIMKEMKKTYGLDISYWNAWYGKELAKKHVHGDDSLSYSLLRWYVAEVERTNPGSHCVLEVNNLTRRFERLFICFAACIPGFGHCRPLLCLDGTFLKTKFKGILLVATAKNGNQGIYTVAFAVVDAENEENWLWFISQLHDIFSNQGRNITFISDRHQGILQGVRQCFPNSPHGFCLYHLTNNLKLRYPGTHRKAFKERIVGLFKKCAYVPTKQLFDKCYQELIDEGKETILNFLEDIPKENWSNAHFPGDRFGEMASNIADSFNSWVLKERSMPIHMLVDGIRVKMMELIDRRFMECQKWTSPLCPDIEKELSKYAEICRHWDVTRATNSVFEVQDDHKYAVNLETWGCSCEMWRVKGYPCVHAVATVQRNGENINDFVENFLKTEVFKGCYSIPIYPIPDTNKPVFDILTDAAILPPLVKKQPGRPRKKRIKSAGEDKKAKKCVTCGADGKHNKKRCIENIDSCK